MIISISVVHMLISGSGSNVCLSVCLKCNFVELVDLSRCCFVAVGYGS